jgi:hypothetical protein
LDDSRSGHRPFSRLKNQVKGFIAEGHYHDLLMSVKKTIDK